MNIKEFIKMMDNLDHNNMTDKEKIIFNIEHDDLINEYRKYSDLFKKEINKFGYTYFDFIKVYLYKNDIEVIDAGHIIDYITYLENYQTIDRDKKLTEILK